jgi:hypothetical protein
MFRIAAGETWIEAMPVMIIKTVIVKAIAA